VRKKKGQKDLKGLKRTGIEVNQNEEIGQVGEGAPLGGQSTNEGRIKKVTPGRNWTGFCRFAITSRKRRLDKPKASNGMDLSDKG